MEVTNEIPVWLLIPFIVMLLTIAIAPLVAEHKWEDNRIKAIITAIIAVPTAIILICMGITHELIHQVVFDYVPFIILLLSLFVVTGGLRIKGDIVASPLANTIILYIGFILASFMGTTGAAMLLIRPLLEINKQRTRKTHTVLFFIALVANCGGLLTPLGDPPLFLLYLRGAEFSWFFKLLPEWAFTGVLLLTIFYIWDTIEFKKEPLSAHKRDVAEATSLRVKGRINFLWLLLVIASVVFLNETYIPQMGTNIALKFLREYALIIIIILSLLTTKRVVRKRNHFTWGPIVEVAILFAGIFVTMTPALMFLNTHAASLGLSSAAQFYYFTGGLSSFLDNAPTAVSFYTVAQGLVENGTIVSEATMAGIPEMILAAISIGSVFFGSMTYIGNGPNFMVKSIAENSGVKMPGFFAYIVKFSLIVLLPVYILVELIFI